MKTLFISAATVMFLAAPLAASPLSPVKTAELSARLFEAGVEAKDPVLILAAAKLRKQVNPEQSERSAIDGEAGEGAPLGWQDMLVQAESLAVGDDALVGLIEDVRAETTKGVVMGPIYNIGKLSGGKSDRYPRIDFKGGEYAEVYVEAKSAVDLNLTIKDAQGRLVCSDSDISHIAYCGWRPSESGSYTMEVDNKGGAATSYALMTN
ncbi:hypothetical protein [Pseudorhodobacter sp.]|uniref:hypothetical protein n=1 Tax=Pseudorhodobacter sp. TaxID=1934400 RepID=UPI002649E34C|nr:hypothetical protein [Pseudorhodobacter sp.]MDN5788644.1 hypothetical protein [Pseudorhodobacter sp.]